MFINAICEAIGERIHGVGYEIAKREPQICIGIGIIGMGASVVQAVRKGPKAKELIEDFKLGLKVRDEAQEIMDFLPEEDVDEIVERTGWSYQQETLAVIGETAIQFAKEFWSVGALFAFSTVSILHGYKVLNGWFVGAVGAFNGVSEAFKTYRERNIEKNGKQNDYYCMTGVEMPELNEKNEPVTPNAEKVTEEAKQTSYKFVFSKQNSKKWSGEFWCDLMFLRGMQNLFTDKVKANEPVVLNDVLDVLGFEKTPGGAVTGWIKGNGDNMVDFGIEGIDESWNARNEVLRYDPRLIYHEDGKCDIVLEFNVDGIVWDKL